MNTNPNAKRILCFGDSNTFGVDPTILPERGRHPADVRWTGVLQNLLGDAFEVIEEGMGGRTTRYQNERLNYPTSGEEYFYQCVTGTGIVDLLIIMISTNNAQSQFQVTPESTVGDISRMVNWALDPANSRDKIVKNVLILLPPTIREEFTMAETMPDWRGSEQRSIDINNALQTHFADKESGDIYLLDMSTQVHSSEYDGVHMNAENHKIFGEVVAEKIKEILD